MSSNRRADIESDNNVVDDQVKKLLKDGFRDKIPTTVINELRRKYNDDDLLDKIQEVFYEKLNDIRGRARKFTKLIEKKYSTRGVPLHIVLKESLKYKDKYNLSDIEFDEFRRQYEKMWNERFGNKVEIDLMPNTNMAQLFGDINSNDGLVIRDSDYPVIQEIIKMYSATRTNHSAVILQSMQYENCANEVLAGKFDFQKHNLACAIHPVVVAMFVPKIRVIEEHFLFTNIAYIIKAKYGKEPLNNQADYNLLYNMIKDANDIVCSAETPLKDIKVRFNLQNNLWTNVHALRSGKFFSCVGTDFINAIDECKISMYDTPDLLYVGDEGVILKRLLGAFSFRPVILETNPIFGSYGVSNPINFPVIDNKVISQSILTIRLPSIVNNDSGLSLESAISQTQIYQEKGMSVPKTQSVVFTNGVIVFHVPRRTLYANLVYQNLISPFQQYEQIPSHVMKNERVNTSSVTINETIGINGNGDNREVHHLRSAVFLEISEKADLVKENIILGTGCIVRRMNNPLVGEYFWYSPVTLGVKENGPNIVPVMEKFDTDAIDWLSTRGTIFIYSKSYDQ